MFSRSFLDASEDRGFDAHEVDPYDGVAIAVQELREVAYQRAKDLVKSYTDRRTQLRTAVGDGFIGIGLRVRERNKRRSIQLEWGLLHFRGGVITGWTPFTKRRGSPHYDMSKLLRATPEWAHELIVETEHEARHIREALSRMTEADIALTVATRRLQKLSDTSAGSDSEEDDELGQDDREPTP